MSQSPLVVFPEHEEPIRAELFSAERLEQHAESLATAQPVTANPPKVRSLGARLSDNAVVLLSVYGWKAWYRSSVASTAGRPAATGPTVSAEGGKAAVGAAPTSSGRMVSKTLRASKAGDVENRDRAVRPPD